MARTQPLDPDEIVVLDAQDEEIIRALEDLDRLAHNLDTRWRIPGTSIRFGIDPVLGLIPGAGDAAAGLISAYIIVRAAGHGVPGHVLVRMAGNVLVDTTVGSIPILGTVFDVYFKASRRNIRLLRRHLEKRRESVRS